MTDPAPPRPAEPVTSPPRFAAVAVPLPLRGTLTYEIPPSLAGAVEPGMRVRVAVGRRRLVGWVVALGSPPPAGVETRPLEGVLDPEPLLDAGLLSLAAFVAAYYLAPIGEVARAMVPAELTPRGARRVALTDRGALASPRSPGEAALVEALREGGRLTVEQLQARTGLAQVPALVERLAEESRVTIAEGSGRPTAYRKGVELAAGELADLLARCGRSAAARRLVEELALLGRPALASELRESAAAGPSVVRRLVRLGVLREFSQPARRDLSRHRLGGGEGAAGPIALRPDQAAALAKVEEAVSRHAYGGFLLSGVTGSGKTEVYLRAAATTLAGGRGVILLVPEIALVPALAREVKERFGERAALLHSGLAAGERRQEWERVRRGDAAVVLGPRSAIFAPLTNLGLVVVDEEQDPSYKQDGSPRYHGRDVALVRARGAGATALLVSATPSLETRRNVALGKLGELRLTRRAGSAGLPEGVIVDLRGEDLPRRPGEVGFSALLRAEIDRALTAGDQVILLRNRRGYAPLLLCRACGEDLPCAECGLPRTYHRRDGCLLCHYCGSRRPTPARCPRCGAEALEPIGAGTERVEERVRELFPGAGTDVLDRDASRRLGGAAAVLERFRRGDTQVLIGTQMVSKGHHFPRVALTGVLLADTYLSFPDFRAVERTYNLLTQLAGRAGRGERPGRVVIQSYHPDHYALRAALAHDDAAFAAAELRFRRVFHYPPFTRMVQLLVRDRDRRRGEGRVGELAARLGSHPLAARVRLLGPAPAPLERLRGKWRFQLLLRSTSAATLRRLLEEVLAGLPAGLDLAVDVDPYQLL